MNSKKLIASMIALAMTLAIVPSVQAATAEELAAQIAQLQSQLSGLMGQLGGTTTSTGTPGSGLTTNNYSACTGVTFSRNLTIGSQGQDVKCLQQILNANPTFQVAFEGVGSAGNESMYFGGLTKNAVVKFQDTYAAEILTPVGLTGGTGFVGASTRAKLTAMLLGGPSTGNNTGTTGNFPAGCTSAAGYSTTTGAPCAAVSNLPAGCTTTAGYSPITGVSCVTGSGTGTGVNPTGAEGSITVSINPSPAAGVKLYEGDSKVAVYAMKIKATGSDVDVQRATLRFSAQPYSYFTNVYLYDGDTEIATSALNSTTVSKVSASDFEITLSNFTSKVIVAKDATKVLTVKVDVLPGISSGLLTTVAATSQNITVGTPSTTSVRAVDQAGLNQYGGTAYDATDSTKSRTFSVNVSQTADATLTVSPNASTPKARNIIGDSSQAIVGATLLTVDVKATKDTILIDQVNNVLFASGAYVPSTGTTYGAAAATSTNTYIVPTTAYLVDDGGTIIGTATPAAITSGAAANLYGASFTDLNYTIAKDTTKTFTIKVDDTLATPTAGISTDDTKRYEVAVFGTQISGTKTNGAAITGSASVANGNDAIVFAEGPIFTLASISTTNTQPGYATASSSISATFNIQVAAVTGDVWIPTTGAFAVGYNFGSTLDSGTTSNVTYNAPSGTTSGTNGAKISQGTSATYSVSATLANAGVAGTYTLKINSIKWGHSDITAVNGAIVTSAYMLNDSAWNSQSVYLQ